MDLDEKLKIFGEILGTKTSRDMLILLTKKPLYVNEIKKKLDIKVSLTIYHLNKFKKLKIVTSSFKVVSEITNVKRKYFSVDPKIVTDLELLLDR